MIKVTAELCQTLGLESLKVGKYFLKPGTTGTREQQDKLIELSAEMGAIIVAGEAFIAAVDELEGGGD